MYYLGKKAKTNIEILALGLTIMLILLRDLMDIKIPFLVYSIVCGVSAVILDTSGRFLYITVLLPFCRGIPYSEMILIVLFAEVCLAIIPARRIKQPHMYLPLVAICAVELVDYLIFDIASVEIIYLLVYMIFTTYAIANRVYGGYEEQYILYYGISTIIAVLSVVIRSVLRYGWEYIFVYNYRFGVVSVGETATNFNANELGLYCAMAAALFLTMYVKKRKISWIYLAIVISLLGLVSVSRTYLLILIGTWGLYLLWSKMPLKQILSILIAIVAVFLLVLLLFPDVVNWLTDYFISRFEEPNTRSELLDTYFDIWLSDMWGILFGFSQNYRQAIGNLNLHATHNGVQEVLVCWGIVGFLCFLAWIWYLYRMALGQGDKKRRIFYMSTIVFWMYVQTLQLVTMHNYLTAMLLAAIPLRMGVVHEKRFEKNNCGRSI